MVNGVNPTDGNNEIIRMQQPKAELPKEKEIDIGAEMTKSRQAANGEPEPPKIEHKEAKAWVKNYMEQNGCSKKDAKKAFEKEFGVAYPSSETAKGLRKALMFQGQGVGLVGGLGLLIDVELAREKIAQHKKRDDAKTPLLNFIETGHFKKQEIE